jgi:hypothetical protein
MTLLQGFDISELNYHATRSKDFGHFSVRAGLTSRGS